jgi:hypothetical protein
MLTDRRNSRCHTHKTTLVALDGGQTRIRSAIADVSEAGAGLSAARRSQSGGNFDLLFDIEEAARVIEEV